MPNTYQPLVGVLVAFCAGIILDRYLALAYGWWWGLAATTLLVWGLLWRRGRLALSSAMLYCALALTGGAWHHLYWRQFDEDDLSLAAGGAPEPVGLQAIALETPRRVAAPPFTPLRAFTIGERSRLLIRTTRIRDRDRWRHASGQAILTVDGHLKGIRAGDEIQVFGRLALPRAAENPGQFDFAASERAERRLALVWTDLAQCVSVTGRAQRWGIKQMLDAVRGRGQELLSRHVSQEHSGLAAALLLGLREQLDLERNEQFLETGMIHVLSISGLHIGMVAALLFLLLRVGWVPQTASLVGISLVTVAYALLTDAGAPVTRAAVLVVTCCLAIGVGRTASLANALAFGALVVLCHNPAELFRTGPQLSFLAAAAIFWSAQRIERLTTTDDPLKRLLAGGRPWPMRVARAAVRRIGQALLLSGAVWLVTAPLVAGRFHIFSPIAIVLNLLLWLPVAGSLLCGFALVTVGWLIAPVATLLGAALEANLRAMDRLVAMGSALPLTHFWLPGPADWWLVGMYAGLALFATLPRYRPPLRWCAALGAGWVACGLLFGSTRGELGRPRAVVAAARPAAVGSDHALQCTFLSVGHGLAVVVQLPGGRVLLYDAGQLGSPGGAARIVAGYLWSRGITHIDAVVLSHADLDHFNGVPELAERFTIGQVFVSPFMFEEPSGSLRALADALARHKVAIATIAAGDRLRTGDDCHIEVRHPTRAGVLGSDNANSVVLAIEYAGRRILLTGDLETPGLEAVLAEESYDCDVLLAPHHGSLRSNPSGMAEWSRPEWVVVSGGHEVDPRILTAYRHGGAHVLHTAAVGAVIVDIDAQAMRVSTFR